MLATQTSIKPSVVWQGSTLDNYTLRLTRSALTRIISDLKQTGLEHLVDRIRSNNQGNLKSAVVSAITQVVNHATASGTVSSRTFGQNLLAFTATGKTRKYQILTTPIDSKQAGIISIRSLAREISRESQYESESEHALQEAENDPPRDNKRRRLNDPPRTRSQTQPPQPGTRQYAPGHVAIADLQNLIDARRGETLSPETPTFLPRTDRRGDRRRVAATGGDITYRAIVNGQRQGVTARITRSMLGMGTQAGYNFPFLRRRTGQYIIRAHLLARVLGGDGSNPRNLVPLYHHRNNLPMYRDIERRILEYVRRGGVVNFSATPQYRRPANDPLSVLPTHIVIRATNDRGASILGQNQVEFSTGF